MQYRKFSKCKIFGRENFDDSTSIHQNSSDFSTVKALHYTVNLNIKLVHITMYFLMISPCSCDFLVLLLYNNNSKLTVA